MQASERSKLSILDIGQTVTILYRQKDTTIISINYTIISIYKGTKDISITMVDFIMGYYSFKYVKLSEIEYIKENSVWLQTEIVDKK